MVGFPVKEKGRKKREKICKKACRAQDLIHYLGYAGLCIPLREREVVREKV